MYLRLRKSEHTLYLYPIVYIDVTLWVKGQDKLFLCFWILGSIVCRTNTLYVTLDIFHLYFCLFFCCCGIQLDVLCWSGHSLNISTVECLGGSKSAVWWAWTKWLSYCNSRQGWNAWIQSTTWKAGSLASHIAHIKEQTGEWHKAFLWSWRSQEWEWEVDSAP